MNVPSSCNDDRVPLDFGGFSSWDSLPSRRRRTAPQWWLTGLPSCSAVPSSYAAPPHMPRLTQCPPPFRRVRSLAPRCAPVLNALADLQISYGAKAEVVAKTSLSFDRSISYGFGYDTLFLPADPCGPRFQFYLCPFVGGLCGRFPVTPRPHVTGIPKKMACIPSRRSGAAASNLRHPLSPPQALPLSRQASA